MDTRSALRCTVYFGATADFVVCVASDIAASDVACSNSDSGFSADRLVLMEIGSGEDTAAPGTVAAFVETRELNSEARA